MASLSVSMIIRNEAARLPAALRSLSALRALDEIVVLDTGSTDASMEIARSFGARVFEQPWQDDFAFHRNHCLDLCRNHWVFILDGDEILEDAGDLDAFLAAPDASGALVQVTSEAQGHTSESFLSIRAFDRRVGGGSTPSTTRSSGCLPASRPPPASGRSMIRGTGRSPSAARGS